MDMTEQTVVSGKASPTRHGGAPPGESGTDGGELLVDLIINQDHVAQQWLQVFLTIQAGLAVGLGFILRLSGEGQPPPVGLIRLSAALVPFLGILSAIGITMIVVRERKWQAWYVACFNDLPGKLPRMFPKEKAVDGSV